MNLDLNAKGFSLLNAFACAQLSEMAYEPPAGVMRIDSALAHVVLADCGPARMVAFPGTRSLVDFITDAKYGRVKVGDGCEVHAGFEGGVASIESQLVATLKNLPPKPLFFMGHSYGGACAVRFADLWDQRREMRGEVDLIAGIYTFGQPRLYNRTGATRYDARLGARTFRIVYEEDIVPRFPLYPPPAICHLHSPYWHCGQEIFLPSTGGYIPKPSLLQLLMSDAIGLYRAWKMRGAIGLLEDAVADHNCTKNYVAALAVLQPTPTMEAIS